MRDRPILFSGPMVRAILAGRKTQTRRVIKPQPIGEYDGLYFICIGGPTEYIFAGSSHRSPFEKPGGRLWVRETWLQPNIDPKQVLCGSLPIQYKADFTPDELGKIEKAYKWRPSIHMPRWVSRITLEIKSVRVERLQDISEEDARAEGVERWGDNWPKDHWNYEEAIKSKDYKNYLWHGGTNSRLVDLWPYQYSNYHTAKDSFSSLWQLINGKRPGAAWADNPWVWVLEFKKKR